MHYATVWLPGHQRTQYYHFLVLLGALLYAILGTLPKIDETKLEEH